MAWTKRTLHGAAWMALVVGGITTGSSSEVDARSISPMFHSKMNRRAQHVRFAQPEFQLLDPALGDVRPPSDVPREASLQGSTIAAYEGDVLVVDADSGRMIRTDKDDNEVASLNLGTGASQLVVDRRRAVAFVADRRGDRIVRIDLSDGLRATDAFRTDREPYGLALTPDGSTLLVTSVADASLTALSTESGIRRWSTQIAAEPRGVAVSPDGSQALVTFLTLGAVARVQFGADDASVEYQSLDPAAPKTARPVFRAALVVAQEGEAEDQGRSFARNAFAATFVGNGVAVVPHQLSTPHLPNDGAPVDSGGYGGGSGFQAPITHRLAFFEVEGSQAGAEMQAAFATTNVHQPRAVAYDPAEDTLYLAGYGSDDVMALSNVSQVSVGRAWRVTLQPGCGPSGLAVDGATGEVLTYCSLTRSVTRISAAQPGNPTTEPGKELVSSRLSSEARKGREIFRRGNSVKLSVGGAMACSNCHAEARSDGLSWFLQGNTLQTPLLAGRLVGAHPFKWDGKDPNLTASLTNTVKRLGGSGLTVKEVKQLTAFLETLEAPRTPTVEDSKAVARGKELFESDATGCAECHYGPLLTDKKSHEMSADLPKVDTPSLIGLAHSAPYYHDGSAQTLMALLEGRGKIHGMGRTSRLDEGQKQDLVAYMQTL